MNEKLDACFGAPTWFRKRVTSNSKLGFWKMGSLESLSMTRNETKKDML
jgi:hypothetical protein